MMEEYEDEDAQFDDSLEDDFSVQEDEEEEDPEGSAFMRGVKEAQAIKEAVKKENDEEEDTDYL
jgi:hypothetical protein